ncbi:hypothetical protein SUGI_0909630 [Cryptomeria japonica]|nr:hypothetical protein SUGI_0909630 [Cryptomeria japonica]
MAASQATIDAASKESKANAKEDLVTITTGAKEKVDRTLASAMGAIEKLAHPLDKEARKQTEKATELRKAEISAEQAVIRHMAHQQAAEERLAARLEVAEIIAEGRGADRYVPPPPPPPIDSAATAAPPLPGGVAADVELINERRLHVVEEPDDRLQPPP